LSPIEGLRGYLAMFVMFGHVFVFGAFIHIPDYFHRHLGGFLDVLDHAGLAVNCFMIVSGFVIFMLIDKKKETYRVFILRRFLRIFPVYFVLLMLALPCQLLAGAVLAMTSHFQSPQAIEDTRQIYNTLWSNVWIHIPLHLSLLHGLVPTTLLPNSATAFLGPAWSLSLEWQFYLIAPLWYALFVTKSAWQRLLMCAVCLFFILKAHSLFAHMEQGAALPVQLAFFLAGIVSYFIYNTLGHIKFRRDVILPAMILIMLGVYQCAGKPLGMIPFMIWCVVMGLLLEPEDSFLFRIIGPFFTNRFSLWAGKISYSIYLSHSLVLIVVQYLALKLFPDVTQQHLLWILLVGTPAITLPFSGFLYRTIEAPFIEMGKRITGESTVITVGAKDPEIKADS
jgi:peptidoglycan/LPS O-acetylase OafA/YrhL